MHPVFSKTTKYILKRIYW